MTQYISLPRPTQKNTAVTRTSSLWLFPSPGLNMPKLTQLRMIISMDIYFIQVEENIKVKTQRMRWEDYVKEAINDNNNGQMYKML